MPAAENSSVVNSTRTVEVKTMEMVLRCLPGAMAVLYITSSVHQRPRPVAAPSFRIALQSSLHVFYLPSRHPNARRSGAHGAGVAGRQACFRAEVGRPGAVQQEAQVVIDAVRLIGVAA